MNKTRLGMLLVIALLSVGASECNPTQHANYEEQAKTVGECKGKGGIAIVQVVSDDDGHLFTVLTNCVFPCDKRLEVEQ